MDTNTGVSAKCRYCGPPRIRWRGLFDCPAVTWPDTLSPDRQVLLTHKGRCGLGLLCRAWGLRAGEEVLMPAYNCGTEVDPFLYFGLTVRFYRVDRQAAIDWEDLLNRVTPKTKVIYVTHYFGWSQALEEPAVFCRDRGIYLVEDCALSLLSRPVQHPIGVLGDVAIYSFPKTLPVPDGGALTFTEGLRLDERPSRAPAMGEIVREMLPFGKRTLFSLSDRAGLYGFLHGEREPALTEDEPLTPAGLPDMPPSYYFSGDVLTRRMSGITRCLLDRIDPERIVHQRREHYSILFEAVAASARLRPLFADLPEGVCPLYLPVTAEDRGAVCRRLRSRGIAAMPWWGGFHRAFDWIDFPEARTLKQQLLVLPVHEQLGACHLEYMAEEIRRLDDVL